MTEPQPPTAGQGPADVPEPAPPEAPVPAPSSESPAPAPSPAASPAPEQGATVAWQQAPAQQPAVGWQQPSETPGPAPGIEFAGHGSRLVAYLLDSVLITVVVIAIAIVAGAVFVGGLTIDAGGNTASLSGAAVVSAVLAFLVIFAVTLVYFPFFWARGGQTPGMMPFRLRVVRDRDGGRIGWGTAWLRLLGMWAASAVFYLGFIWIFIDGRRRGWHDLIAGTVVIRDPETTWN
jgi:uncharacterized RDD family membrane protein YckC